VFVKGAPEIVIQRCTSYIGKSGVQLPLDDGKKIKITDTEICKEFSKQSYRTLLVAYASFEIEEWD
jgi:magnesium-transporting ATPase (P-type)